MKRFLKSVLPKPLASKMRGVYMIGKYHSSILKKKRKASSLSSPVIANSEEAPSVTIYITNSNNSAPLELTLRTLFETTTYLNYEVVVADNNSKDSSVEMVEAFAATHPVQILTGESRPQHEWYDHFMATCSTDYWVGIHEDMMFIGDGWLADMIEHMESHKDLLLLGGEYFPPGEGIEPVSHALVDMQESLSTWIFCVRREIRDQVSSSFAFHSCSNGVTDKSTVYDQGGKLIEELRNEGLGFDCMPPWFLDKWQHIGNISWAFKYEMNPEFRKFKLHQVNDVQRRVRQLRKQGRIPTSTPL